MDIDTFLPMLFAAGFSLAPPFRQLFTKRVEPNGFLSSDWLNVVVNLLLLNVVVNLIIVDLWLIGHFYSLISVLSAP